MNMNRDKVERLFALPVEMVSISDGVILKRGCMEICIRGSDVREVLERLFSVIDQDLGSTRQQICEAFASSEQPAIMSLIEQLTNRKLLMPSHMKTSIDQRAESNLDIFYWHLNTTQEEVSERLRQTKIVVLGINQLSQRLVNSLHACQFQDILVIDCPTINRTPSQSDEAQGRNDRSSCKNKSALADKLLAEAIPETADCIVAVSDYGATQAFQEINSWCIHRRCTFLPVTLQNMIGYVGPLVIPGETACYECLRRRMLSHLEHPDEQQAMESFTDIRPKIVSLHPLMLSMLADAAAFDLFKFYCGTLGYPIGTLIELRLLARRMTTRTVLKLPRCPVCSPAMTRPSTTLKKSMFTFSRS